MTHLCVDRSSTSPGTGLQAPHFFLSAKLGEAHSLPVKGRRQRLGSGLTQVLALQIISSTPFASFLVDATCLASCPGWQVSHIRTGFLSFFPPKSCQQTFVRLAFLQFGGKKHRKRIGILVVGSMEKPCLAIEHPFVRGLFFKRLQKTGSCKALTQPGVGRAHIAAVQIAVCEFNFQPFLHVVHPKIFNEQGLPFAASPSRGTAQFFDFLHFRSSQSPFFLFTKNLAETHWPQKAFSGSLCPGLKQNFFRAPNLQFLSGRLHRLGKHRVLVFEGSNPGTHSAHLVMERDVVTRHRQQFYCTGDNIQTALP